MISKETENKIIELCNSGMCIRHIAKELNLSDGPVKRVLKENGLKAVDGSVKKYTEEQLDKAIDLYNQGYALRRITEITGVHYSAVNKELDKRGIAKRNKKAEDCEDRIIVLYEQGVGSYQIADRLGCSRTLVVKVADENGIERRSTHISDEMKDKIEELYTQGNGIRIITRELNTTRRTVVRCLRDRGYDTARNSTGKLTIEKVTERLGDQWEYVSGYERYNSKIVVRCRHCGTEKEVSRQSALYGGGLGECRCFKQGFKQERRIEAETEKILGFWQKLQKPRPLKRDIKIEFCGICGKPFIKEGRSPYCSEKCSRRARRLKEGRATDKRLRRMKSGEMDDITLDDLIVRDSNICWICGKPCDQTDFDYNGSTFIIGRMYPTIDHVFPLSKGGTHTWDNVRLAHMICNSLKRDKLPPGCLTRADSGS